MYLLYVDESGDTGQINSPTKYFVLSAIVIHEVNWLNILDDLIKFRRLLKTKYDLRMKEEIHAAVWVSKNPALRAKIPKWQRFAILKECLKWLNSRTDISIYTVRCDKTNNQDKDIFLYTWQVFIQRFDNTLSSNNFPGGNGGDKGIVIPDNTHGKKLTGLLRKMRRVNYVPNMRSLHGGGGRNLRLKAIIKDPILWDSAESYLHQLADVVAYFARQYYEPNRSVKKRGAKGFYSLLKNVVNTHVTYKSTPNKIVEI